MELRRLAPLAAFSLALGCSMPLSLPPPGRHVMVVWVPVVGLIESADGAARPLSVPDTVQAGAWFAVTVATFGSRGCFRPGDARVDREPTLAVITPYDSAPIGARTCIHAVTAYPRPVPVRFDAPGPAVIRLQGRGLRRDTVIEQPVVVVSP